MFAYSGKIAITIYLGGTYINMFTKILQNYFISIFVNLTNKTV